LPTGLSRTCHILRSRDDRIGRSREDC
jgi:hypothetical protein